MAVSLQQQGIVVTTFRGFAAPVNLNAPPVNPNSFQSQQRPDDVQKLLEGENKALGVVQIMLGIIQIVFGFALYYSDPCVGSIGTPWWTGVWYIISGALAILVEKIPKTSLIVGNLVMNILSTIAAGLGIVIYTVHLNLGPICFPNLFISFRVLVGCLLGFTGLQLVISLVISGFSCRGLRCSKQDKKLNTVAIQSVAVQNSPAQVPQDGNYETLLAEHSTYESLNFN